MGQLFFYRRRDSKRATFSRMPTRWVRLGIFCAGMRSLHIAELIRRWERRIEHAYLIFPTASASVAMSI